MSSVPDFMPYRTDLTAMRFARMALSDIGEVQNIEDDVYPHPWTHGNFLDSLYSGYDCWVLRQRDGMLAGYFLLMFAIDEAHLLNITVRRDLHRRGLGRALLDKVAAIVCEKAMTSVLLEVRPTNVRALEVYRQYGFDEIGRRKGYYPAANNTREDAIVMRLAL